MIKINCCPWLGVFNTLLIFVVVQAVFSLPDEDTKVSAMTHHSDDDLIEFLTSFDTEYKSYLNGRLNARKEAICRTLSPSGNCVPFEVFKVFVFQELEKFNLDKDFYRDRNLLDSIRSVSGPEFQKSMYALLAAQSLGKPGVGKIQQVQSREELSPATSENPMSKSKLVKKGRRPLYLQPKRRQEGIIPAPASDKASPVLADPSVPKKDDRPKSGVSPAKTVDLVRKEIATPPRVQTVSSPKDVVRKPGQTKILMRRPLSASLKPFQRRRLIVSKTPQPKVFKVVKVKKTRRKVSSTVAPDREEDKPISYVALALWIVGLAVLCVGCFFFCKCLFKIFSRLRRCCCSCFASQRQNYSPHRSQSIPMNVMSQ